jgi:short-subunit dehydrogenase
MESIAGRVVLVTGASRGLGAEMAERFASEGARLALAARSEGDLDTVRTRVGSTGAEVRTFPADVGDLGSLKLLVPDVEAGMGSIDVLVNNAGIEDVVDFEHVDLGRITDVVTVNLLGTLWLTRLVLPGMIARRVGHVVNISSMAGLTPVPHNAVYAATKHGLVGFSRSLRLEIEEHGIGVSVVCPGLVRGGMFAEWGREPPRVSGSVSTEQVARAVVNAVRRNLPEVVVAPMGNRLGVMVATVSPRLFRFGIRRTGVFDFLAEQARLNRDRRAS